jgi:putative methionine-R-sulfoxide reductase with GAF domain
LQTVPKRLQSANAVLTAVKEKLSSAAKKQPEKVLDGVVEALSHGRGYAWTGIYLAVENLGVRQSASGPTPASATLADLKAEIAVPIKLGSRTMGLIVAETGRPSGAARQERALLQQVTKSIAHYLTTNRAKQLPRTTRENFQSEPRTSEHKGPQSERPASRKAAAGERIPR